MSYYRTCPYCGANLDSGERCDCREEQAQPNPQALADLQKKAPVSAANTNRGGVDQIESSASTPYDT